MSYSQVSRIPSDCPPNPFYIGQKFYHKDGTYVGHVIEIDQFPWACNEGKDKYIFFCQTSGRVHIDSDDWECGQFYWGKFGRKPWSKPSTVLGFKF